MVLLDGAQIDRSLRLSNIAAPVLPVQSVAGGGQVPQYGSEDTDLLIMARAAQNMPISDMPTPNPTASTIAYWRHCCLPYFFQK